MQYFFLAFFLSIFLTLATRKLALKFKIVDSPNKDRKKHKKPIALLGGTAIFVCFWLVVGFMVFFTDLIGKNIEPKQLIGVFIGSLVLIILGFFDDKKELSAKTRLIVSAMAVLIAIFGGVHLLAITNPFGGIIHLDFWQTDLGFLGKILVIGDILVFAWLMGMMYTTKILDGLDGLTTGIVAIGALIIFFLSNYTKYYQPDIALIALVFAGACLGFLVFNFHPAKVFLGEGGGLFLGFILGILAVISGGKIATALLVMAVPILDLVRVIYTRLVKRKKVFKGDREHLHFRLLQAGLTHKQAVWFLYAVALLFGMTTLFFQSRQKLVALIFLVIVMIVVSVWLSRKEKILKK